MNGDLVIIDRFCDRVIARGGECWEWDGAHATNGYAQVFVHGRLMYAHRLAYELMIGPIPEGLHIDHLCRNRGCVRPSHLEAVTQGENNQRSWDARKGVFVCRNGHRKSTKRSCPECARESQRRYRHRKAGVA